MACSTRCERRINLDRHSPRLAPSELRPPQTQTKRSSPPRGCTQPTGNHIRLPGSARPAGFSPPVHRVNEVRRAIQRTPAWTDSPCCSRSCRAGIKQTRQACRQLSAKKIMKEQGSRAKPSHLDQPSGEFNFSQAPQQRSVSVPQPRPRGCCSITSVPGCPALIS